LGLNCEDRPLRHGPWVCPRSHPKSEVPWGSVGHGPRPLVQTAPYWYPRWSLKCDIRPTLILTIVPAYMLVHPRLPSGKLTVRYVPVFESNQWEASLESGEISLAYFLLHCYLVFKHPNFPFLLLILGLFFGASPCGFPPQRSPFYSFSMVAILSSLWCQTYPHELIWNYVSKLTWTTTCNIQ